VKESHYAMHFNFCFTSSLPFPMSRQEVQNLVSLKNGCPSRSKSQYGATAINVLTENV